MLNTTLPPVVEIVDKAHLYYQYKDETDENGATLLYVSYNDGKTYTEEELPESAVRCNLHAVYDENGVELCGKAAVLWNLRQLRPELFSTEPYFKQLRAVRDERLKEYDKNVLRLERLKRLQPENEELTAELAAWDAYALALCALPDQPGAPWDGGGDETPWPLAPVNVTDSASDSGTVPKVARSKKAKS